MPSRVSCVFAYAQAKYCLAASWSCCAYAGSHESVSASSSDTRGKDDRVAFSLRKPMRVRRAKKSVALLAPSCLAAYTTSASKKGSPWTSRLPSPLVASDATVRAPVAVGAVEVFGDVGS